MDRTALPPQVTIPLTGSNLAQQVDPSTYDDVLQNTLVISSADRSHHASLFECRAINNNVTDPPT